MIHFRQNSGEKFPDWEKFFFFIDRDYMKTLSIESSLFALISKPKQLIFLCFYLLMNSTIRMKVYIHLIPVTGNILTETLHSENGSPLVGQRTETRYSTDANDLKEFATSGKNTANLKVDKHTNGISSVTKTKQIGTSEVS